MTTTALDLETTRRFLAEAIAEKGEDYVYPLDGYESCAYLEYDTDKKPTGPSCLVGHVLVKAGVPMAALMEEEGSSALAAVYDLLPDTPERLTSALRAAQTLQDAGETWGSAVAEFERVVTLDQSS